MIRLVAVVALCCVGPAGARARNSDTRPPEILVAAAVSLTEAIKEVAARFEAADFADSADRQGKPAMRVALSLAASNTLARQAAAGARIDVFVSADQAQLDVVRRAGLVVRSVDLLANELVVVVPSDSETRLDSVRDLGRPEIARIAIGDPAGVPAGVYAKAYLERTGVWAALQPKLVPSASVRAALAAVESGNVDAAIVYRTDAAAARRVRVAYRVSGPEAPRIVYPAALLSSAPGPRRFFDFLQSPAAGAIFARHGFTPLAGDAGPPR